VQERCVKKTPAESKEYKERDPLAYRGGTKIARLHSERTRERNLRGANKPAERERNEVENICFFFCPSQRMKKKSLKRAI